MAIKCANCKNDAIYTVADYAVSSVDYCLKCLPRQLSSRALHGDFKLRKETKKKEVESKVEDENDKD